jgi:hypothetical protein
MGDLWAIINKVATSPTAFVLTPAEVIERAHRGKKDGRISFWLQPIDYDQPQFKEAWERIVSSEARARHRAPADRLALRARG